MTAATERLRESWNWDDVLREYGNLVSTTVRSFQLQDADALDAVQTTWLRLVENTRREQFPDRLGGWLVSTARNECLRIRQHAEPEAELSATRPERVPDSSLGPEQRVIDAHTAQMLWNLVADLPPLHRLRQQDLFTDAVARRVAL